MIPFDDYWQWLLRQHRGFATLGGRSQFVVNGQESLLISSNGTQYQYTEAQAEAVLRRFDELGPRQQDVSTNYTDPIWNSAAGRNLGPWLASTVSAYCQEVQ
jgi:aryl-alcohol dehydrogenase-like predicted oxidoreductase